jgi:hypothetical protein
MNARESHRRKAQDEKQRENVTWLLDIHLRLALQSLVLLLQPRHLHVVQSLRLLKLQHQQTLVRVCLQQSEVQILRPDATTRHSIQSLDRLKLAARGAQNHVINSHTYTHPKPRACAQ